MNSKECLKWIDEKYYLTEREYKEFLSVIEQDLDRLEELEEQVAALDNSVNNLALDLDISREENSKLKKAIEIILKYKINPSTFIFTRKIYKESCGKDLTFEKAYALLEFDGTQEEYELLKEVLENDK